MRFGRRGPSLGAILLLAIAVTALLGADCSGVGGDGEEPGGGAVRGDRVRAQVERVVDGDTIEVEIGSATEDVRYIGIDTPESVAPGEPVKCFGKAASAENDRLVGGETVTLVFDAERRDDYGRLLAYVFAGEIFVNGELVEGGFARTLEIEPNTAKAQRLGRLEAEAGREGRGLWGACP